MEARVLESSAERGYLVQVRVDERSIASVMSASDLIAEIRISLADKIAQKLFEQVDPVIMAALRGDNKPVK